MGGRRANTSLALARKSKSITSSRTTHPRTGLNRHLGRGSDSDPRVQIFFRAAKALSRTDEATVSKSVSRNAEPREHGTAPRQHSDSTVTLGTLVSLSS